MPPKKRRAAEDAETKAEYRKLLQRVATGGGAVEGGGELEVGDDDAAVGAVGLLELRDLKERERNRHFGLFSPGKNAGNCLPKSYLHEINHG